MLWELPLDEQKNREEKEDVSYTSVIIDRLINTYFPPHNKNVAIGLCHSNIFASHKKN